MSEKTNQRRISTLSWISIPEIFHLCCWILKLDRFIVDSCRFLLFLRVCVSVRSCVLFYGGSQVNLSQRLLGSEGWASSGPCVWVYGCFSPMDRAGNVFDSSPFLLSSSCSVLLLSLCLKSLFCLFFLNAKALVEFFLFMLILKLSSYLYGIMSVWDWCQFEEMKIASSVFIFLFTLIL